MGNFYFEEHFEEHLRTAASEETIGSDWIGLSFWRVAFKTTKIPVALKLEPSLNLIPTVYLNTGFLCSTLTVTAEKQTLLVPGLTAKTT